MSRPRQFETGIVLEQAMVAFWSGGFEATSIQRLCAETGLSPASLYGAFGDKRALFLASLEKYMGDTPRSFELFTAGKIGGEGLRAFFKGLIEYRCALQIGCGCFVTNTAAELAAHDQEIAHLVDLHFVRMEEGFAALLEQADDRGELVTGAGRHNAAMLVCLTQGLNVLGKIRPRREELQRLTESALALILRSNK